MARSTLVHPPPSPPLISPPLTAHAIQRRDHLRLLSYDQEEADLLEFADDLDFDAFTQLLGDEELAAAFQVRCRLRAGGHGAVQQPDGPAEGHPTDQRGSGVSGARDVCVLTSAQ